MKRIIILIPIFNDWDSLNKLLAEINNNIKDFKNFYFECLIVNDASTISRPKILKPPNIRSLRLMNMKINKGHARCNAFGIRYVFQKEDFDYLILMDGDGEDRPIEIRSMINKISTYPEISVVAKRIKRSEGFFFKFLYSLHKIITKIFTGKKINFGNYTCLTSKDVTILSNEKSLWSSFSGSVKKHLNDFKEIESIRGSRYYGPSKMSLFNLITHSFAIMAVFKYQVFFRSFLIVIILFCLNFYFDVFSFFSYFLIGLFNILIFLISLREQKNELFKSQENLESIEELNH